MTHDGAMSEQPAPHAGPRARATVDARCPLRPGEPCTLCHPEATGPQNCPTVGLVMDDDELRAELALRRRTSPAPSTVER